ncbi:MAG: hypothetical protein ACLUEQ_12450 [Cloacibacillus evryensis]
MNISVGILEGYGLTECSPVVSKLHGGGKEAWHGGTPLSDYDRDTRPRGKLLDIHQEGALVKGPSVVPGYFRDEENTKERFHDGWFNTGDVVR